MAGKKKNTVFRRKRKGKPFTGVQRYGKKTKETPSVDSEIPDPTPSASCDQTPSDGESDQPMSASRLKMRPEDASNISLESFDDEDLFQGEGYRLVDLKKLSATLSEVHVCEEGCLTVKENTSGRNGLMADLSVECSSCHECINSLVWARCPKHKHHGVKVVRCAVASAVCHFHSGAASRERIMQRLSIPAGEFTRKASLQKDTRRLRKSDLQASVKEKKRRQGMQQLRTRREEALREAEGVTYEAGGF